MGYAYPQWSELVLSSWEVRERRDGWCGFQGPEVALELPFQSATFTVAVNSFCLLLSFRRAAKECRDRSWRLIESSLHQASPHFKPRDFRV